MLIWLMNIITVYFAANVWKNLMQFRVAIDYHRIWTQIIVIDDVSLAKHE